MKILVIKQTSLGDVLHSTGIVRNIKQAYPQAKIVLLTATASLPIYQYNPWVDEIIEFDRYAIKRLWYKKPIWCLRHIISTMKKVRAHEYAMAFDLQGLLKSVIFLYGAKAKRKFVKGRWWGVQGFHNRQLHAIVEMQRVVQTAGIELTNLTMEIHGSPKDKHKANVFLNQYQKAGQKVIVISPFTRVLKKDWPLEKFIQLAQRLSGQHLCIITSAADRADELKAALIKLDVKYKENIIDAAGALPLLQFAELIGLADVVVSADSFAVHLAGAMHTPVVALFGPTDESKVGPLGPHDMVLRPLPPSAPHEVAHISVDQVAKAVLDTL